MQKLEKEIIKQLNKCDSITLGYMRNGETTLEIGLTSYIDIDFVGDIYSFLGSLLHSYKTQSVKITIVDVDDGDKNPLDAVISIQL